MQKACLDIKQAFFVFLVPSERFELPTFGLQNRCTTTVLRGQRVNENDKTNSQTRTLFGQ